MKHVLFYEPAEDFMATVGEHFPSHRALWGEYRDAGTLLMIGTLAEPPGHAMAVFTTEEAARDFVAHDPFVTHGVVGRWRLVAWDEALTP